MNKFYPLIITKVKNDTRDTIVVTFNIPEELKEVFQYKQGQHLTLRSEINGSDVRRSYSICSAVQDQQLRIAIKRVSGGIFSTWANETLKPGQTIQVMPPSGNFNIPLAELHEKRYLAIAAGSGITPIISIIKTTLLAEPKSRFTLIYGNRSSSSVIFKDELCELKDLHMDRLIIIYVMSREHQDIELLNGRINKEKCNELFSKWIFINKIHTAFICGPEEMINAASISLQDHGMEKRNIKFELFATSVSNKKPKTVRQTIGKQECEVTVVMDGNKTVFFMGKEEESILDAGLKHGLDMRYSCKDGVCATCRCKVVDGKVDMDSNYALEDYEIARGFILSCQSFPVTDKLTVDFDQDN